MRLRSVDKKAIMGITGLMLVGFVVMHLLGNLTIFFGPEAINEYAATLRRFAEILWVARIALIAAVILHIAVSIVLARENRAARPVGYALSQPLRTSLAARTMMISGLILLAFIVYHLLHFTFRVTHPAISHLTDAAGRHDVYTMVVISFHDPYLAAGYVLAMGLLCAHLSHGIGSFLQSLGLNDERLLPVVEKASRFLAAALFVGYASIPVSVLLGVIR